MKALIYDYRCAKCNTVFKSPALPDQAYAQFLMRGNNDEIVYFNALEDDVAREFEHLFDEVKNKFKQVTKENDVDIFQDIFSITCDLASDGSQYKIHRFPACPECGSREMAGYGDAKPHQITAEHMKPVTHEHWNKLSEQEKKALVIEAIKNYFNKSTKT